MYHTIYCDMDGVLADFHIAAARIYIGLGKANHIHTGVPSHLTTRSFHERWPRGWSLQKWLSNADGKNTFESTDEFWKPIREDPLFWRCIPAYSWWKELTDYLQG